MPDTRSACAPRMGYCAAGRAPTGATNVRQRAARAAAGAALLALSASAGRAPAPLNVVLAAATGWVGLSHLMAATSGYEGCPELGAIPTLVLGRPVHTRCGPWQALDQRLGLTEPSAEELARV